MANNNKLFESNATLTVTRETFNNRDTGENIVYNAYHLHIGDQIFKIKLEKADKKLFEFIAGIK